LIFAAFDLLGLIRQLPIDVIFLMLVGKIKFGLVFAVYLQRLNVMCAIEMKLYVKKLILLVSCTLVFFAGRAQSGLSPIEDMVNAMKTNRVADMAKYFDNFVPITINNSQVLYSRNQAEVVLKDFFDKNNPSGITVMDNGSPDPTSKFCIGSFTTPAGVKYSFYILMRLKGSFVVQDLRLNKE
jgi:Domain of unknown function (DUF4783)